MSLCTFAVIQAEPIHIPRPAPVAPVAPVAPAPVAPVHHHHHHQQAQVSRDYLPPVQTYTAPAPAPVHVHRGKDRRKFLHFMRFEDYFLKSFELTSISLVSINTEPVHYQPQPQPTYYQQPQQTYYQQPQQTYYQGK